MKKCTSCKREVTDDYVEFKCPKCGKEIIIRCLHCRKLVAPYVCTKCGFEGP